MSSTRKTSLTFRPAACAAILGLFCLTANATAITIKAGNAVKVFDAMDESLDMRIELAR